MAYQYSTSPTYIGTGQTLKIRYNSPVTWDTNLSPTIQVQIGLTTGTWVLGNRKPRTTVQQYTFIDNEVRTSASGAAIAGNDENGWPLYINKNTLYYSNIIEVKALANLALDYFVPITLSTTDSGKTIADYEAQYRVRAPGGSWGSWLSSKSTIKEGYEVQLRMRSANAYTTQRNITLKVGFDGNPDGQGEWPWNIGANAVDSAYDNYTVSDTWSITTRQQDVVVDQYSFDDLGFTNLGAVLESEYVTGINSYYYEDFSLTGIDNDSIIRVRVKDGKTKFANQTETNLSGIEYFAVAKKTSNTPPIESSSEWKTEVTGLKLNDQVWVRLKAGNYTTQRRVTVEAYAITADGNNTNGSVTDEWKVRTETDKYPDAYALAPIYTISDGDNVEVTNSSTTSYLDAEINFVYRAVETFTGFGVEYDGSTVITTLTTNGDLQVATTLNGTYGNSATVTNNTTLYFRITASPNYTTQRAGTASINGISSTMTIKTREPKTIPYPWTWFDKFWPATGGLTTSSTVIRGVEVASLAEIIDQNVVNAQLSVDNINWSSSVNVTDGSTLRCRLANPSIYGPLKTDGTSNINFATIRIGGVSGSTETYNIYPVVENDARGYFNTPGVYEIEVPDFAPTFFFDMSGAGGGQGGDDAPNSHGGPGGTGIRLSGTITNVVFGDILEIYIPGKGSNGNDFLAGAGGGAGGSGYLAGGQGGNAGTGDKSGGGGGGGGAACIRIKNGPIIAIAGGGGGGAGAGNDTKLPTTNQYGNKGTQYGSLSTTLASFIAGANGGSVTAGGQGGGGGGAGAGAGSAGVAGTNDTDGTAGTGGGAYYNPAYFTVAPTMTTNNGAPSEADGYLAWSHPQQDITPEPFSFDPLTDQEFNVLVETPNKALITGITGNTSITVTGNSEFRILDINGDPLSGNGSAWKSSGYINNDQTLQIRTNTSPEPSTTKNVYVTVGSSTVTWSVSTRQPDDTDPFPITIPAKTNQNLDVPVYSDDITVQGINVAIQASVDSGEFRVCNLQGSCTAFSSSPKTVYNGYTIRLKKQSANDYNTSVFQLLSLNTQSANWEVKTKLAPVTVPNSFVFDNQTVPPGTLVTSTVNNVQNHYITGINSPVPIWIKESGTDYVTASNVQIYVNDVLISSVGGTTSAPGNAPTISNGDKLYLKFTSPASAGTVSKIYLVTGGYEVPGWGVTNTGVVGTDPNAFSFPQVTATGANSLTTSNTITISGLGSGVSVNLSGTNNVQIKINNGSWVTATATNPISVANGDQVTLRIFSNEIEGQSKTTTITAGGYETAWTVITPYLTPPEPKRSKWYSEFTERLGLPIGSVVAVFKDATTVDNFGFGNLDGKLNSRFHGWIECDGRSVDAATYPLLFDSINNTYGGNGLKSAQGIYSGSFNLPDFRNRKVLGTGLVDSQAGGSASIITLYGPDGNGSGGSTTAGSQGGYWFIDTVDAAATPPPEQVISGNPQIESVYFSIGQIITTGYSNVTGSIEFTVPPGSLGAPGQPGVTTGVIYLGGTKLYDIPYHQHEALSAKLDDGLNVGTIPWNGSGARTSTIQIEKGGLLTLVPKPPPNEPIDYWGWPLGNVTVTPFATSIAPGDTINGEGDTTWEGGGLNNMFTYIDQPSASGRWACSLSPFATETSVKSYKSSTGTTREHTHYLSATEVSDELASYSYGNSDDAGTAVSLPAGYGATVTVGFTAEELGIEVFPGTFTLNSTTQIIPTPALSPQSKVPLVTPYFRAKWVIRAF